MTLLGNTINETCFTLWSLLYRFFKTKGQVLCTNTIEAFIYYTWYFYVLRVCIQSSCGSLKWRNKKKKCILSVYKMIPKYYDFVISFKIFVMSGCYYHYSSKSILTYFIPCSPNLVHPYSALMELWPQIGFIQKWSFRLFFQKQKFLNK